MLSLLLVIAAQSSQPSPAASEDTPLNQGPPASQPAREPAREPVVEPPKTRTVDLVYSGPMNCFRGGSSHIYQVDNVSRYLRERHIDPDASGLSFAPLRAGGRVLFPEDPARFPDPDAVAKVLESKGELKRTVVERDVPMLVGTTEVLLQYPFAGQTDLTRVVLDDPQGRALTPVLVELARYEGSAGTFLAAEMIGARDPKTLIRDPSAYFVQPSLYYRIKTDDDDTRLFAFGQRLGTGARALHELSTLKGELRLYPGARNIGWSQDAALCGNALRRARFDAMAPRRFELGLGPKGLSAYAREHQLPYLAANLEAKGFKVPRFKIFEINGLSVAVTAFVHEIELEQLAPSVAKQWQLSDPTRAARSVFEAMRERTGGAAPDLVVVIGAGSERFRARLANLVAADVVLADFDRWADLTVREETVIVARTYGGRERAVGHRAWLAVRSAPYGVGTVRATFDDETRALRSLHHVTQPVLQEGPYALALARPRRVAERAVFRDLAEVLLPEPADLAAGVPALEALTWGESVLYYGDFRRRRRSSTAQYTDPLWMKIVTELTREATGAELVVMKNLARGDSVSGPIAKSVLASWVPRDTELVKLRISGAQIARVLELLARQKRGEVEGRDMLFVAGLDENTQKIGGRAVRGDRAYTLVTTNQTLELSGVKDALARAPRAELRDNKLRPIVFAGLSAREANVEQLRALVATDDAPEPEWRLAIDRLSVNGSAYQNSDNVGLFAETQETRATTPNLFNLGLDAKLSLIYDDKNLAWELGALAQLNSVILNIPGQELPPQEQRDDLLAFTELRVNAVKLDVFGDALRVVPFVRATVDSEITPTPIPNTSEFFPRQLQLREELGLVATPGSKLKEIRVGALLQQDLSEVPAVFRNDWGFTAGYKAGVPLFIFALESELDLRYLIPDGDDRARDLSLRAQWVNRLVWPLYKKLSVYLMLDLFGVTGKLPANSELAGSAILGVGLRWQDALYF